MLRLVQTSQDALGKLDCILNAASVDFTSLFRSRKVKMRCLR